MNVVKNLKFGVFALGLAGLVTACSSDDDNNTGPTPNQSSLKIVASASYGASNSGLSPTSLNNEDVELTSFIVNFEEIELELEDVNDNDDDEGRYSSDDNDDSDENDDSDDNNNDSDDDGFYDSDDDIELQGPFEYDLLAGNNTPLVDIEVPNGVYEEVEFEFNKSQDPDSELLGKSMEMTGEINGQTFVFWHDFEEEIEVDYEDTGQNLVIDDNASEVVINFDLASVVGTTGTVDLSTATDNDGDGVITISPQDEDGNNALAEALKEAIKAKIELLDD